MTGYEKSFLDWQSFSEVNMDRGSPICKKQLYSKIMEQFENISVASIPNSSEQTENTADTLLSDKNRAALVSQRSSLLVSQTFTDFVKRSWDATQYEPVPNSKLCCCHQIQNDCWVFSIRCRCIELWSAEAVIGATCQLIITF